MRTLAALGVVAALLLFGGQARAACSDTACSDQEAVDALRAEIAETCACGAATSHGSYMKCVRGAIKDAIRADRLPRSCKKVVRRCEGSSTCGRAGAAVCCGAGGEGRVVKDPSACDGGTVCTTFASAADSCDPDGSCAPLVRPFRTIQEVFSQSCALPSCHSGIAREGNLVLESEELSWNSLVEQPAAHEDAAAMGLVRVKSGDPENSYLIRKLRGLGPGDSMPQGAPALSESVIDMIEDWIARGAHTTEEECPAIDADDPAASAAVADALRVRVGKHSGTVHTVCDDEPIGGDYVWEPEPPLPAPSTSRGVQIYVPQRPVDPGTEWETCYAVQLDWLQIGQQVGMPPGALPIIKSQEYRMHEGSHHLLLYAYYGPNPGGWRQNEFFPCSAANCREDNPDDCPPDANDFTLPIGGTQVAGTRYVVTYPPTVGLPLLSKDTVIIANLHYTNPFQPQQPVYGEAWLNLTFHRPEEFKVLLDGIFAVNFRDLLVEPYQSKTFSRIWQPRSILGGGPADAAVFQLFGHMHKRGTLFDIDYVRGGACSVSGALCGRDDDCACKPYDDACVPGQTCILGPEHEDTRIYHTTRWDHAPVQDFPEPYVQVDRDEGLRWTCTMQNGVEGDPTRPPKRCHVGCSSCEWRPDVNQCVFERDICLGYASDAPCATDDDCTEGRQCRPVDCNDPGGDPSTMRCARVFNEGDPIPLVFGELADDDMCNMFGYFIPQAAVPTLPDPRGGNS